MIGLCIPVLPHNRIPGKVRGRRQPPKIASIPIGDAMTRSYSSEASTAGYALPASFPHRLVSERLPEYGGIEMQLLIVDVDDEEAHKSDRESSPEWWTVERTKLVALLSAHPGGFVYRTRRGYRIVYQLGSIFLIGDAEDAAKWSASYLHAVDYLETFGIKADRACADWTHLYILPRATRNGAAPERRETIGNPAKLGKWTLEIVEPAPARPRGEAIGSASESVIGRACIERGLAGKELEGGAKLVVKCPFYNSHGRHAALDGSTVVYAANGARKLGHLHCSHGHCKTREPAEFRRALGIEIDSDGVRRLRTSLAEEQAGEVVQLGDVRAAVATLIGLAAPGRLVSGKVTLGAGKTRAAVHAAVDSDRPFVLASPRHDLTDEIAARLIKHGEKVDRRRGLLRVAGTNGAPACKQHLRASELQAAGGSVPMLCKTCEHQRGCPARQREARQRVIATVHKLASVAMDRDEADASLDRPVLIVDETPELLEELSATRADLEEATRLLTSGVLEPTFARNVAAWLRALIITVSDAEQDLPAACARVDRDARREPTTYLGWSMSTRPNADAVRLGKIKLGREPELAADDLLGLQRAEWLEATRAIRLFRPILAAARDVRRITWRKDGFAVHVATREAELLTEGGAVVLDATPPIAMLEALCNDAGIDLVTMTLRVADGAPHTRTVLYSANASRSKLAPGKVANWSAIKPLITRGLDAVRNVKGRILLVTFKTIADGIRAGKLADVLEPFGGRVDVAHYGAVRGLDLWRDHDACATVGDPWPELGSAREQAATMGLDAEAHLREVARAELAQAHGRLRDPSRSRPATHVHLGTLAPLGWTEENTMIETKPRGRPRIKASTTTEELREWVSSQKSQRTAAKLLGLPLSTLQRCLQGQALPAKAQIPHRGFRVTPASKSDPVIADSILSRDYRVTPPCSVVPLKRGKRAVAQAAGDPETDTEGAPDAFLDALESEAA